MILVDTSAWVEYLRDTGSSTCLRVDSLLSEGFHVCDPVRLEVLAGARDDAHLLRLRRLLALGTDVPVVREHYDVAAALHRQCRRQGRTVRKMMDCLIAATAVQVGVPVLHADADFDALVACTALRQA